MGYMDEKIIQVETNIKENDKKRHSEDFVQTEIDTQSIFENNITVYGVPIKFSKRIILNERCSIFMPTDFEELDSDDIAIVYPLGNPPQSVFGNSHFDFTIGFNHTEHSLPSEAMKEFAKVVKVLLEKAGPKVHFFGENFIQKDNLTMSTLEFTSHTLTDVVYNMMFFSVLDAKVLIGFINFNSKNMKRCKPIAKEVINSFAIFERGQ